MPLKYQKDHDDHHKLGFSWQLSLLQELKSIETS